MGISFDPAKNEWNIRVRGLPFDAAADFYFEAALYASMIEKVTVKRAMSPQGCWARDHMSCALSRPKMAFVSSVFVVPMLARSNGMPRRKSPTDSRGEVREISSVDLKAFRPARETLPNSVRRKLGVRGPQQAPTKERITIRLSSEVVAPFRATGDGWQSRMDAALQDWLRKPKSAA
jgi:uncharacterized protein (DUF4415 family)